MDQAKLKEKFDHFESKLNQTQDDFNDCNKRLKVLEGHVKTSSKANYEDDITNIKEKVKFLESIVETSFDNLQENLKTKIQNAFETCLKMINELDGLLKENNKIMKEKFGATETLKLVNELDRLTKSKHKLVKEKEELALNHQKLIKDIDELGEQLQSVKQLDIDKLRKYLDVKDIAFPEPFDPQKKGWRLTADALNRTHDPPIEEDSLSKLEGKHVKIFSGPPPRNLHFYSDEEMAHHKKKSDANHRLDDLEIENLNTYKKHYLEKVNKVDALLQLVADNAKERKIDHEIDPQELDNHPRLKDLIAEYKQYKKIMKSEQIGVTGQKLLEVTRTTWMLEEEVTQLKRKLNEEKIKVSSFISELKIKLDKMNLEHNVVLEGIEIPNDSDMTDGDIEEDLNIGELEKQNALLETMNLRLKKQIVLLKNGVTEEEDAKIAELEKQNAILETSNRHLKRQLELLKDELENLKSTIPSE